MSGTCSNHKGHAMSEMEMKPEGEAQEFVDPLADEALDRDKPDYGCNKSQVSACGEPDR